MQNDILSKKKIVVGVTGCIAAYKSGLLIRKLIERGAEVKVVMTPSACEFITPLTLSALSRNEVIINIFPQSQKINTKLSTWHIDISQWADLMVIAPATVNTIAKIAHGFADNALTTLVSALRCPLIIAPAADVDMYLNPVNLKNIKDLTELGYYFVEPEEGELASGLKGKGRLADISKIIDMAEMVTSGLKKDLIGKKILVTAGPTYEDIDPVRFIGNRSSGKMGFQIAKAAYLRGADVTLVSGPSSQTAYPEINLISIRTANEMKLKVEKEIKKNDILIMSAAVADYRPKVVSNKKIKKEEGLSEIKLIENNDILSSLRKENKIVVGFALETDNEIKNAKSKLKNKYLDMIVLNSLTNKNSGFDYDTNKITIIYKNEKKKNFPLQSKFQAANNILSEILSL